MDDDDLVVKLSTPREHTWGSNGSKDPWIQWIRSNHSAEEERLLAAMHMGQILQDGENACFMSYFF